MKIVVAGSTGFLGRALVPALGAAGHSVVCLVRGKADGPGCLQWNPDRGVPEGAFDGAQAVINLCGENIAGRRWTSARRRLLAHSRIGPTAAIVAALARPRTRVTLLINASALGYYGDTGERVVTEASPPGDDFLARLCLEWEETAVQADAAGMRIVRPRFGIILGPGGAVAKMAPLFKACLGGRLGSGRQWMGWVGLDDAVRALVWCLDHGVSGPVNVCSPKPVRNAEFTRAFAHAVQRPVGLPVPELVLQAVYGEMAREALLTNSRAEPQVLVQNGFQFRHVEVQGALLEALASK